jgi:hypothetical protein
MSNTRHTACSAFARPAGPHSTGLFGGYDASSLPSRGILNRSARSTQLHPHAVTDEIGKDAPSDGLLRGGRGVRHRSFRDRQLFPLAIYRLYPRGTGARNTCSFLRRMLRIAFTPQVRSDPEL